MLGTNDAMRREIKMERNKYIEARSLWVQERRNLEAELQNQTSKRAEAERMLRQHMLQSEQLGREIRTLRHSKMFRDVNPINLHAEFCPVCGGKFEH